jgi:4-oxalocrotonate tautomerase
VIANFACVDLDHAPTSGTMPRRIATTASPASIETSMMKRPSRRKAMPEVYVHAIEGRSKEQKRALIKDITDAVVKNFGVTVDAVLVEIIESSRDNKAKGGVLFSER